MAMTFLGNEIVKKHLVATFRAAVSPKRIDRDPPRPAVGGYAMTLSPGCAKGLIEGGAYDEEAPASLRIP